MLFNSYPFLLLFLPVTFAMFFLLGARSPRMAAGWLALASLAFYGWWDLRYVPLLLASVIESHNRHLIDQANRLDLCKDGRTVLSGKKGS